MSKNIQNNELQKTLTGKIIIFWLFSILIPIACIVAIVLSVKVIKEGNKAMITLLVFAIIDLIVSILDMIAVGLQNSAGALRGLGIVSILALGLVIQGIFMILIADYVTIADHVTNDANYLDEDEYDVLDEDKYDDDEDNTIVDKSTINRSYTITNWKYYKSNHMLELYFGNKIVHIYDIDEKFIKGKWSKLSLSQQTKYFFKNLK